MSGPRRIPRPTAATILALGFAALLGGCVDVPGDYGYGGGYDRGYTRSYAQRYATPVRYTAPAYHASGYGHQTRTYHHHDHDRW